MPLPCPGPAPISLGNIQTEFGGSNPIGLGEYYRNGGLVSSNNTNVPTSGTISLSNFFCAVNEIVVYITSNSENVNVQSLFGGYWTQNVPKRLVINSGVVVGGGIDLYNVYAPEINYAIYIPSGLVSTLRIDNNGSIQGAGGFYGGYPNGVRGGHAIYAGSAVTIDNIGSIYGGGGGGGFGGNGGDGTYYYECFQFNAGQFSGVFAGSGGGNGGQGQGYAQNATGGSAGDPSFTYCGDGAGCDYYNEDGNLVSGGTVCYSQGIGGAGGTGGAGGSFGNNGGTGQTGGSGNNTGGSFGYDGGSAGCYITNSGNVTWVNTGDRRGQVC
jgi:hypothetical protein